jgi:hypothetical protein
MIPPYGRQHRPVLDGPAIHRFAFAPAARPVLALIGINASAAWVRIDGDDLDVRFGPWRVRTRLDNVISAQPTGPLTWWQALGTRLSFVDHGLTFGSSTHGAVCVRFAHPVTGMDPFGLLRHPELTVTVATPAQLVAQLDQVRQPRHGVEQAASSRTAPANFVPINTADNRLHHGLAIAMVTVGLPPERRDGKTCRQHNCN